MHIFTHKWLALPLWPISWLYGMIVRLRNLAYDRGILQKFYVDAQIVSVGNITVGGTGKTPATITIAATLQRQGRRVAILSRGYGRRSRGTVVVADSEGLRSSVADAGDEPFMMARALPGVPVVVDGNRVRGARLLVERFGVEVIVLDDGFQHRRLAREVDIVLLDVRWLQRRWLLPAGPYREPLSALRRAHLVLLVGSGEQHDIAVNALPLKVSRQIGGEIGSAHRQVTGLLDPRTQQRAPIRSLAARQVYAVAGIAEPASLRRTLEAAGAHIVRFDAYGDHRFYRAGDLGRLVQRFRASGADFLVTTMKDWVKLEAGGMPDDVAVRIVEIAFVVHPEQLQVLSRRLSVHN